MKNRKLALATLLLSAHFLLGCDVAPPGDTDEMLEEPQPSELEEPQPSEGSETSSQALEPITAGTLWTWAGYLEKAWNHYKKIGSLYNGSDADLAQVINGAKEEILKEMRGIVEQSITNRTEAAILSYSQITTHLRSNPDATSLMAQRIPEWLNSTTETWVDMKNALEKADAEYAYRILPVFNTLSTIRATMLKNMSQLRPPMPVSQETIDELLAETLRINYRALGAPVVSVSGTLLVVAQRNVYNTIRGKRLASKFFGGYQADSPYDKSCDSACYSAPYYNVCSWERRKPCYDANEAATMAKMAADPVAQSAWMVMNGIAAVVTVPLKDPIYFRGEGVIPSR